MRRLILAALMAWAGAARAEDAALMARAFDLEMQATQARQREIDLGNQLTALETRAQAERTIQAIVLQRLEAHAAAAPEAGPGPAITPASPRFATLPDARLAASNARVRAAAKGRVDPADEPR